MLKKGVVSKTTYYRRLNLAKKLGVTVDQLPDRRGKGHHARGDKTSRWNSGVLKSSEGYVLVRVPKDHPMHVANGYAYEHRLMMSEHLGRPLESYELVHHKNEVKDDNRLDNFELTVRPEHNRIHNEGRRDSVTGRLVPRAEVPSL